MTINWNIENLECKISENGLNNVVFKIQYVLRVTDIINEKPYSSGKRLFVQVSSPDPTNFTEFEDLTKEQVVGWITASLGETGLSYLTSELSAENTSKANPTTVILNPPFFS